MLKIGPLDRRIEIQQLISTPSATSGRPVGTWLTVDTVWANLQDQMPSRDESIAANAIIVSKRRTRVRIRWNTKLTSVSRVRVMHPHERTLQVISEPAEIGGRRMFMEFMAEEVSTDG